MPANAAWTYTPRSKGGRFTPLRAGAGGGGGPASPPEHDDDADGPSAWRKERGHQVAHHDFGQLDDKGRKIGAQAGTWTSKPGDYDHTAQKPFAFRPHATRNGKTYGAVQRDQRFATEAQRDIAIKTYLGAARARATPKIGKPQPTASAADVVKIAAATQKAVAELPKLKSVAEHALDRVLREQRATKEAYAAYDTAHKTHGAEHEQTRALQKAHVQANNQRIHALGKATRSQLYEIEEKVKHLTPQARTAALKGEADAAKKVWADTIAKHGLRLAGNAPFDEHARREQNTADARYEASRLAVKRAKAQSKLEAVVAQTQKAVAALPKPPPKAAPAPKLTAQQQAVVTVKARHAAAHKAAALAGEPLPLTPGQKAALTKKLAKDKAAKSEQPVTAEPTATKIQVRSSPAALRAAMKKQGLSDAQIDAAMARAEFGGAPAKKAAAPVPAPAAKPPAPAAKPGEVHKLPDHVIKAHPPARIADSLPRAHTDGGGSMVDKVWIADYMKATGKSKQDVVHEWKTGQVKTARMDLTGAFEKQRDTLDASQVKRGDAEVHFIIVSPGKPKPL